MSIFPKKYYNTQLNEYYNANKYYKNAKANKINFLVCKRRRDLSAWEKVAYNNKNVR